MNHSEIISFENGRFVHELFANEIKNVRLLEERFGVKVTTRDGWLRIDGAPDNVRKTRKVIDQLQDARDQGLEIGKKDFHNAMEFVEKDNGVALSDLQKSKLETSTKRPPVIPRTLNQKKYIEAIKEHELVFGLGPAGTGKTFLAVAAALAAFRDEEIKKIILTRPAVEAGEELGFLPGELEEKIFPYLRPLYDALEEMLDPEELRKMLEKGIIELAPLAFMRGRTLSGSFIILDEAQNTTAEQMLMFLTRLGQRSRCVITGDPTQVDLPKHRSSGLFEAISALKSVSGICFCEFDEKDVVRHKLVRDIVEAYRIHRSNCKETK
ncbi:PhoH family protein [Candidatus Methylacidiphilum fumarolicum]|uniref:PhoH-like protein n=2 Tax=Candidatus Methylacidiphilum fumarolicum TaxID=591154 RepID=I0JXS2_METFB|nr:PhoH family protein [Candidatus Methylacidiphilum fumarolicum]MBW6415411.1 PhoH family protein [Candidatus Methylacidiphilum fumarolicum]TFE69182.1 phosphate starvation-inducible protein PhoH [Candidatus Methylacidiphilum fumarolicum]TFE72768.1 PhoH family protein [Candidatus Methylacidiphilum fumarolicum]TFE74695.1 PhoH family protein [Candidatus Methylacidiphilum fumarolicum]TFE77752.1 phosphate starvation-inducible protein PhoH [Candidatus Methylacidiphilum fumarolicum]